MLILKNVIDDNHGVVMTDDLLQALTASFLVIDPLSSLSISLKIRQISSSLICLKLMIILSSSSFVITDYQNLLLLFPSERVLKQGCPLLVFHLAHHCLLNKDDDDNDDDGNHDGDDDDDGHGNLPFGSSLFAE